MEEGGGKEVIDLNSFRSHRGKDRINHRNEGLITISDSSDEELPVMLDTPVRRQWEDEEDDDVVILMEVTPPLYGGNVMDQPLIASNNGIQTAAKKFLRPNVIKPAAPWQGVNASGEGGSSSDVAVLSREDQKTKAPSSPRLPAARRNCLKAGGKGPSRHGSKSEVLELPDSPEPVETRETGGARPEAGPSAVQKREAVEGVINVEEVVLVTDRGDQDERGRTLRPRLVPSLGGIFRCIEENTRLDPPYFQPAEKEARTVVNLLPSRPAQPEIELGPLPRVYQGEIPGPAFPRPEPPQDGIPGPASPQLAHPPEENGGQQAAINEQAGPAFPLQGSLDASSGELPKQSATLLDKDLVTLLIRETEARFPDATREYIEELIRSKNCSDLNILLNLHPNLSAPNHCHGSGRYGAPKPAFRNLGSFKACGLQLPKFPSQ